MTTDFDNPNVWLENLDTATKAPRTTDRTHPGDPNFAERVTASTQKLVREHHIVTSLAELRKHGAALTQTEVAQRWGRAQSRVSSLEADLTKIEIATLMDYVRALGGALEVSVTVDNHTYTEQLV
jgi:Helix-turn-helix domain